ncbi:XK-related protein 6-like [Branchiostoma floridae]|uniref:XK-related protein n=1 Tax=Branchiostoma floridae TaxID=7739 RepID=A0A9J7LZD2_BRAFL|nr:XK-related protein 6-like [Branchiostoma floridae]
MAETADQSTVTAPSVPNEHGSSQEEDKTDQASCLGSIWNSKPVQIFRFVLFPLGLYLSDVITDLMLAVQYYNSGDRGWFGWTLGFVIVSSIMTSMATTDYFFDKIHEDERTDDDDNDDIDTFTCSVKTVARILQLGVLFRYFDLFCLILRGVDVEKQVENGFSFIHYVETLIESIPQLYLQIYIIGSTGEQVSVLKIISMVISLLSAVKTVVARYHMSRIDKNQMSTCRYTLQFLFRVLWRSTELSSRVLAVGLFVGAFRAWAVIPIVGHFLIMAAAFVYVALSKGNDAYKSIGISNTIVNIVVETFSVLVISYLDTITLWLHTMLTLLSNIAMVTVWYNLRTEQDFNWFHMGVLVSVVAGSVVSAVCCFIFMVLKGRIESLKFCCDKPSDQEELTATNLGTPTEINSV